MSSKYDLDTDGVPRDVKVYREKGYWDERFETETKYDWIGDLDRLEATEELVEAIGDSGRCLVLGCGTSTLGAKLVAAGVRPEQIVNTDYSEVVVEKMKELYAVEGNEVEGLTSAGFYQFADMTKVSETFPTPGEFTVVIDKCSIDALTVDPGDVWDPDEKTRRDVTAVLNSAFHALSPGGVFYSYTFNQPHFRKPLYEAPALFDISMKRKVDVGMSECYVFVMTKPVEAVESGGGGDADEADEAGEGEGGAVGSSE